MKTIVMYLPQYHRVKENDTWWGEGYTDWIAAQNAKELFEGHYQPREPLDDNYYDLTEKKTMMWQANLMQQYGIDGLCFYHYYFKDGRKILEKPAENLLKWKDINMPFCFCWDNTPWARTWSKISEKTIWTDRFEGKCSTEENGILLEQKYGREKEWKAHFEYLLPFFRDERYIKVNGKPVFIFYRPSHIICLAEMAEYWRKLAEKAGFGGIYLLGTNITKVKKGLDAVLIYGPGMYWHPDMFGKSLLPIKKYGIKCYDYKELWEKALKVEKIRNCKTYFGGFVDYDDTPRRGKNGILLQNVSVESFKKYWYQMVLKNKKAGNDLVFLNAFNEWGEGNYLEPDKQRGYAFLEAVLEVKEQISKETFDDYTTNISNKGLLKDESQEELLKKRVEKFKNYFSILNHWLELKEQNKTLDVYFKSYQYSKIAVYGLGVLGKHLLEELKNTDIEISYAIDKKNLQHPELEILSMEEELPPIDAVIVTATFEFDEICEELRLKVKCPIISLEEIMQEV